MFSTGVSLLRSSQTWESFLFSCKLLSISAKRYEYKCGMESPTIFPECSSLSRPVYLQLSSTFSNTSEQFGKMLLKTETPHSSSPVRPAKLNGVFLAILPLSHTGTSGSICSILSQGTLDLIMQPSCLALEYSYRASLTAGISATMNFLTASSSFLTKSPSNLFSYG